MYKVYFYNFGYFSANESATFEGAEKVARKAGFCSTVVDPNGNTVGSYDPIGGFRTVQN